MISTYSKRRGPGRPAACADEQGDRCGVCRLCMQKAEVARKRREEIALAARLLASGETSDAVPREIPREQAQAGLREVGSADAGVIHRTKAKLPAVSVLHASPWEWKSFGPAQPAPPKTEEEEAQQASEEATQERVENPSATAQVAAHFLLEWFKRNVEECKARGLVLPMTDNAAAMEAFYSHLGKLYLHSCSRHLPDLEPTDLQIDLMTIGSLAGSELLKLVATRREQAAKAPEVEDDREAIDTEETPAPEVDPDPDDDDGIFGKAAA